MTEQQPSITCPRCGATSYHPEDIKQGYCGRCHWWTSDPDLGKVNPETMELDEHGFIIPTRPTVKPSLLWVVLCCAIQGGAMFWWGYANEPAAFLLWWPGWFGQFLVLEKRRKHSEAAGKEWARQHSMMLGQVLAEAGRR